MKIMKHNEPDSAIRRPSGLTDAQWDWLVEEAITRVMQSQRITTFLHEMVGILFEHNDIDGYQAILTSLGISGKEKLLYQNWEHTAFRFFRHFCPENFRNACGHSGLPFATLEYVPQGKLSALFMWISELTFEAKTITKALELVDTQKGDTVTIIAMGQSDIETVKISNGSSTFEYYHKEKTKSFGDVMYLLKRTIIANTKKGRNSDI